MVFIFVKWQPSPPTPHFVKYQKTSQKGLEVMKADQITDGKINLISEVRRVLLYDRQTDGQKDTSSSKFSTPPPWQNCMGEGGG